jgi:voltage-gated sodium channel
MKEFARSIVQARWFEPWMVALILLNAVIIGLETSHEVMDDYGRWLQLGNDVILGVFVLEAVLKITSVAPQFRRYFGDGWNLFDFTVVVLSFIPSTGEFALVARLVRVLRVLRLVSAMPQLRLIVATLVRSIPSMGHVLMLLAIIFYIYAITGFHLFHQHDPEHWGTLGAALLTLFQIVTLEGWVEVMEQALEFRPLAWIYFVSFVLIGTFVVLNLFIAVVVNNLEASKAAELEALARPVTHDDVLEELARTRDALQALQRKLASFPGVERRRSTE